LFYEKKACVQKKDARVHVEKDVQDMNNRINARYHAKRFYSRHENREKSLAACFSQVNLYVFNIPSLQLIQLQPSLLFSESEPEAITPSHTAGACH